MYETFHALPEAKRQQILDAGLRVFAAKGYTSASTDEVVKEAGISKGALFHYFGNKETFFTYLYDYVMEALMRDFYNRVDNTNRDMIARWRNMMALKLELTGKHPSLFDFAYTAHTDDSPVCRTLAQTHGAKLIAAGYAVVLDNVDTSLFRPDIDPNVAIRSIYYTISGYSQTELDRQKRAGLRWHDVDYPALQRDVNTLLDLLKTCYYRKDESHESH